MFMSYCDVFSVQIDISLRLIIDSTNVDLSINETNSEGWMSDHFDFVTFVGIMLYAINLNVEFVRRFTILATQNKCCFYVIY